jgi:hypothetical protein
MRLRVFIVSGVRMQYCVILDVEEITDATAVGILLQRYGYKIVSAQIDRVHFSEPLRELV